MTCNSGFTLKGSATVSCTESNGQATLSTLPTCEKGLSFCAFNIKGVDFLNFYLNLIQLRFFNRSCSITSMSDVRRLERNPFNNLQG